MENAGLADPPRPAWSSCAGIAAGSRSFDAAHGRTDSEWLPGIVPESSKG